MQFRQSAFFSEEEERQRPGTGVRADDGTDKIDCNVGNAEALAHLVCQKFRILTAVPVTDEDGLLCGVYCGSFHAVNEREDGVFASARF